MKEETKEEVKRNNRDDRPQVKKESNEDVMKKSQAKDFLGLSQSHHETIRVNKLQFGETAH